MDLSFQGRNHKEVGCELTLEIRVVFGLVEKSRQRDVRGE